MKRTTETPIGNIGQTNLGRLQQVKNQLEKERAATLVNRLAHQIDKSYEALLSSDEIYPEIAEILRKLREKDSTKSGYLNNDYYQRCASEIVAQGLIDEEEHFITKLNSAE
jgi:hypothetical protein